MIDNYDRIILGFWADKLVEKMSTLPLKFNSSFNTGKNSWNRKIKQSPLN